jgi:hypothetical protein
MYIANCFADILWDIQLYVRSIINMLVVIWNCTVFIVEDLEGERSPS